MQKYLILSLPIVIVLMSLLFLFTPSKVYAQAMVWEKVMTQPTFSKPDTGYEYRGKTVTTDKKNNIYLGGWFSPTHYESGRTVLTKFTNAGELVWEYEYPYHIYPGKQEWERLLQYFLGYYVYFNSKDELNISGCIAFSGGSIIDSIFSMGGPGDLGLATNNKHDPETGKLLSEGYIYPVKLEPREEENYGVVGAYHHVTQKLRSDKLATADYLHFTITDDKGVLVVPQTRIVDDRYENLPFSIEQTSDGGVVVLYTVYPGQFTGWGLNGVVKFDTLGNILWIRLIKKTSLRASAAAREMPNGDIAVMGYYRGVDSVGKYYQNAELTMFSKDGDSLWTKIYKSKNKSAAAPYQMRVTRDGGLIVCGAEVNFAQNSTASNYENDWDIWLMKLDKNFNEVWQTSRVNLDSLDYANDIHIDNSGDYVVTGYLNWTSMYLAKFKDTTVITSVGVDKEESLISISPNPARGRALLGIEQNSGGGLVLLYNTLGQEVQRVEFGNVTNISLDLSGLTVGCYNAVIKTKRGVTVKKIIVN